MREAFLHYIWQFQYFNKRELLSEGGEKITVFNPGMPNSDAGPDFQTAKIRIGTIEWSGSVEIHSQSSEWESHKHDNDPAYDNVILHVVWKNNKPAKRRDGTLIPTLTLTTRIDDSLLSRYKKLINNPSSIPCQNQLTKVDELIKLNMIDKALAFRLEQKSNVVLEVLAVNQNNWEETAYSILARNFGFKINAEPFNNLARILPLKILLKHVGNQLQIEALLFGQAGFLEDVGKTKYEEALVREYRALSKKYRLDSMSKSQWKFLRLRPANFPTLRIAQFAALINTRRSIFSQIVESMDLKSIQNIFLTPTSDFWKNNYQFGKSKKVEVKPMGVKSLESIMINTVVPIWVAYGRRKDDQEYMNQSIHALQEIKAEQNSIIKKWTALGFKLKSAHESQALIGQYNDFCKKKKCLKCAVGHAILQSKH